MADAICFPAPRASAPLHRALRGARGALASLLPAPRLPLAGAGSAAVQLLVDPVGGRVVDANARAAAFYGRSLEAMRGAPLAALDAGDEASLLDALRDVVLLDGLAPHAAPLRRRQRAADGGVHDVELYPGVVRRRWGGTPLVHAIVHDVSDRRRLERERDAGAAAMREMQRQFERICDTTPDLVYLVDLATRDCVFVNQQARTILGYNPEEIRLMGSAALARLMHPEEQSRVHSHLARLLDAADGEVLTHERRALHADGSTRWLRGRSVVFARDAAGRPTHVLNVSTDVTESRAATERLRRSEERLTLLMRAAPVGIFQATPEGAFTFANQQLCDLVGLTAAEVLGEGWTQSVHPGDLPWVCATWSAAVRARAPFQLEFRIRGAAASERWVVARAQPTADDGYLGSLVDITVLKESERALILARDAAEQASQSKSDFLSRMSHELRTPLTAVIGFARLLNRSANERLTPQERGFMERIDANAQHLIALISNILDLAKIDAGKLEVELAPTDLGALATATLAQLEGTVRKRDLVLRAEVPDDLALLETDGARLRQVLINLVGNAIKFTERGSVTVVVEADPSTRRPRRLQVRDTGIGIPRERQAAIFEVFEQGDNGTTRRFGGTGLGLAISRELCTLLGATLDVESVEGEGTTFTIEFAGAAKGAGAVRAA